MNFDYYGLLKDYIISVWKLLLIPIAVFAVVLVVDLIKQKGKIIQKAKLVRCF